MKSTYADDLKFHDKLMELVLFFHGQLPHMTPPEEKKTSEAILDSNLTKSTRQQDAT
jgi:hypothetical protein